MPLIGFRDKQIARVLKEWGLKLISSPQDKAGAKLPGVTQKSLRAYVGIPQAIIPGSIRAGSTITLGTGSVRIFRRDQATPDDLFEQVDENATSVVRSAFNLISGNPVTPDNVVFMVQDMWGDLYIVSLWDAAAAAGCGDLLAGWRPDDLPDTDQTNCAGTATVTLLSSDVPYGPANVVNRDVGFIGRNSWLFLGTSPVNSSTLWVDDSPDFLDVTQDFTIRLPWNSADSTDTNFHFLLDIRGGVEVSLVDFGYGIEKLRIDLFDGTSVTRLDFVGIPDFADDTWYVIYLRWDQSTRVMTVNVMAADTDLAVTADETLAALSNDIDVSESLGIFISGSSQSSPPANFRGLNGRIGQIAAWQKRLIDCELAGDYNCGLLSTLPAPNMFFTGPGGLHRKPAYISAATEPILATGERVIWRDTANSQTIYLFNDPATGQAGVELTV